jgi:hypothetical protein
MPYCPVCGDSLSGELTRCKRCVPPERRAVVAKTKARVPAARFTALMRGVEVLMAGSSFLVVGYVLGTAVGVVPPVDIARVLGTPPAIAATQFLIDPITADPPPPFVMELADARVIDLRSGDHFETSFEVRDPRACTLTGRVRGLAGGRKDVEVYVLDEDGYLDWQSGLPPHPVYEGGRSPSTRIHAELPGRGRYHLLLSNRFSFLTAKRVRLDDARVRCA